VLVISASSVDERGGVLSAIRHRRMSDTRSMACFVSSSGGAGVEKRAYALWISVSWAAVRLFSFASLERRFLGSAGVVEGGGRRFGGCEWGC